MPNPPFTTMSTLPVVSRREWSAAREWLLVKEKELTRACDALAAERRRMPWVAVERESAFAGRGGTARRGWSTCSLGRSQLIVYRSFFEPGVADWPLGACRGCSFLADQVARPVTSTPAIRPVTTIRPSTAD